MKLDAKFYGEIRKVKDDSIVPEDQYIVFLAKDKALPAALMEYRRECAALGADNEQIEAVTILIAKVRNWQRANPDLCKVPDAKGEKMLG